MLGIHPRLPLDMSGYHLGLGALCMRCHIWKEWAIQQRAFGVLLTKATRRHGIQLQLVSELRLVCSRATEDPVASGLVAHLVRCQQIYGRINDLQFNY